MTLAPDTPVKINLYMLGSLLVGVVSAVIWFDSRYAHAENVNAKINAVQATINVKASELRRDMLEDKVFELEAIPVQQRTDAQRAILNRTKAKLQAEEAKLREAERKEEKTR